MKTITVALILLMTGPAFAGMRCGNKLIQEGDSKFRVIRLCGEPDMAEEVGCECGGRQYGLKVERLYYRLNRKATYIITIEGGEIEQIETEID